MKNSAIQPNPPEDVISVTAVIDPTYPFMANITMDPRGNPVFHPSITTAFMQTLQIAMERTFLVKITEQWGDLNEDTGEWDGMIAHLLTGQADIAMSPLIDVPARRNVVDFSISLVHTTYTALYRLENYQRDPKGLLRPFQSSLWLLGLLFLVIAASLLLYKTFKKQKCRCTVKQFCKSWFREQPESWDFVHTIGILCTRSLSLTFGPSLAEKLALLTVSMVGYLLTSLYTATVLYFLTSDPKPIKNLDQLLSTSFTFGFANFYPMLQAFKTHHLPSIQAAYARRKVQFNGVEDAKSELLRGSYAFFGSGWNVFVALQSNFSEAERCLLREVEIGLPKYFASAIRKTSSYRATVNYHIIEFKQYGLNKLWIQRNLPSRPECLRTSRESLSFEGLLVAFYGLLMGAAISIIVLGIEWSFQYVAKKWQKNPSLDKPRPIIFLPGYQLPNNLS